MPWSAEQLKAIHTVGKNILVAAAAGSGKTSVLVERVIEHITSGRCDINEILVVTFTNAAAAEMRERIAAAITEKLPDKDKERQLVLLNAASISTLHSFCQNIIRQNFHELGLDPKFRLGSEQECALLKQDVLEELFEQKYDAENNDEFLHFTDMYGSERGDDAIYSMVLKLYEYSRSQPFPALWLKSLPHHFDTSGEADYPWLKSLQSRVHDELVYCRGIAAEMCRRADELKIEPLQKVSSADLAVIDAYLNCSGWDELQKTVGTIPFVRMSASKKIPDDVKDSFKRQRDEIKSILKKMQENYFSQPMEEVLGDMPALQREAAVLCDLTLDFAAAFAKAKAEKALLDFSDLEHFALQLLAAPGSTAENLLPSPAACRLQEKYKEIMVDEYQDTNGVQEAIIRLIASREKSNCFFVGDVKQSIYKFRLAEPELFLQKYNDYPSEKDCERIDLAQNFRSRREILTAVNFIFKQIMTVSAAELPYGEAEALRCGFDYPKAENLRTLCSPVELVIIDKKGSGDVGDDNSDALAGFNAEAAFIVQRIKRLMKERPLVYDKNDKAYRPLKWRDIVILMRTIKEKGQVLSDALRSVGIPVYSSDETGYFQASEVRVMLSLLQIIDNPYQDIPLTAVLFSPIVGLSEAQLAQIRLLAPETEQGMYEALRSAKDNPALQKQLSAKISDFLARLEKWRDYARCRSVPELVWYLLDKTGYYDYVGGMKEGLVRQANLRALYDRAGAYEKTSFRGLFRFLRFIQRMKDMGSDLEVARSLSESEDVVRIMSIHKSKGLEFPVVIAADIGKRFNLKDAQQEPVLIHKHLGLGLYVTDDENHIRYQTLSRQAIADRMTQELKSEEMRTLYVAMTRAREKLIMVGSVADAGKFAAHCCGQVPQEGLTLSDHCIKSASSYLDWLGTALVRHADGLVLRQRGGTESAVMLKDDSCWQIEIITAVQTAASDDIQPDTAQLLEDVKEHQPLPPGLAKDFIEQRLSWQYPYQSALAVPAKLSVTEIKRRFALEEQQSALEPTLQLNAAAKDEAVFKRPLFLQRSGSAMTATEYGTLMHTVMQHLDFKGDLTDKGILGQLRQMAASEIISSDDVHKIYRKNIREFFNSSLGLRLQRANRAEREIAFSRVLSAHEINALLPDKKKPVYPESDGGEAIFIQGVIDLLFYEDDGLVLIDYKTDRCSEDDAKKKYAMQIKLYAAAAQAILQKKVKEKYLYLFHSGSVVSMEKA